MAQQWPATSGGIHTGCPARAETSTSASGSASRPSGARRDRPKIRLMQAGM